MHTEGPILAAAEAQTRLLRRYFDDAVKQQSRSTLAETGRKITNPAQIWVGAAYHLAFRCGGWAHIRLGDDDLSGAAGGERNTTALHVQLAGLAAALGDAVSSPAREADGDVLIHTASAELATLVERPIGDFANMEGAPDLALLARIYKALEGRRLRAVRAPPAPNTPAAFATAWAETARDKAKMTGAFSAAIPKLNLTRASAGWKR